MGMIKCERHGLQGICFICPHIAKAKESGIDHSLNVVFDDWKSPALVCDNCLQTLTDRRVRGSEPEIGLDHWLDEPLLADCFACVDEWVRKVKGTPLLALIDQARDETFGTD